MSARQGEVILWAVTLVWGTTFTLIQLGLEGWAPFTLLAARFGLATLALLPWVRVRPSARARRAGLALGLWAFLGFSLQTWSLAYTSVAHAAFGTTMNTVMVPLYCILWRGQRAPGTVAALFLASMGLQLMLGHTLEPQMRVGDLLALGSAVAFAVQIVLLERYSRSVPYVPLVFIEIATAGVLAGGAAWWRAEPLPELTPRVVAVALYLGVIATAGCLLLQVVGQAKTSASRAAFIYALEPICASLLAWWARGQSMSQRELTGGTLMAASALLADRPWPKFNRRPPRLPSTRHLPR